MTHEVIAPHESIEIHEILAFKNVCLTKSLTMSALVSDAELKSILQQDVTTSERHVKELKGLLEKTSIGNAGMKKHIAE
jgi:similar to spore coat protein